MPLDCRKASVRASAARWNLDALVASKGNVLALAADLGAPSSAPQAVKGGSCRGLS